MAVKIASVLQVATSVALSYLTGGYVDFVPTVVGGLPPRFGLQGFDVTL